MSSWRPPSGVSSSSGSTCESQSSRAGGVCSPPFTTSFDVINPATNRNLRAGGVVGSPPGWPTDEKIESLRAAWFGAADSDRRRQLADRIQQRAFEIALYLPTGQFLARRAFRKNLAGVIDAPIPFLWNIEKRP